MPATTITDVQNSSDKVWELITAYEDGTIGFQAAIEAARELSERDRLLVQEGLTEHDEKITRKLVQLDTAVSDAAARGEALEEIGRDYGFRYRNLGLDGDAADARIRRHGTRSTVGRGGCDPVAAHYEGRILARQESDPSWWG